MAPREVLLKMKAWIKAERLRAKRPFADPFVLMSLAFCAEKAVGTAEAEETLAILRSITKAKRMSTYDVLTPNRAAVIINYALASHK